MTIRVALDWTPNTVHTGLLVAHAKGYYEEAGLVVTLISPQLDNYETTPAKKLISEEVDLAVCPSESVIAYAEGSSRNTNRPDKQLQAVFTLLDQDASSILCASSSGIARPKDLDGKVYGSYNAKYEDNIVRAMIRNDGGFGNIKLAQDTAKLDLFDILTKPTTSNTTTHIDATWVFSPWEGIKAKTTTSNFVELKMHDYGIPYGYSPLLARLKQNSKITDADLKKFVEATRKAYSFAKNNPEETLDILVSACPGENRQFLAHSLESIQQFWSKDTFGYMEEQRWQQFLNFLKTEKLLTKNIEAKDLFVNF